MIYNNIIVALVVAAVTANAQSTTTTSPAPNPSSLGLTECIMGCVTPAAENNGCGTFSNLQCVCESPQFKIEAAACLVENCTAEELQQASNIQELECQEFANSSSGAGSSSVESSSGATGSVTIPVVTSATGGSSTTRVVSSTGTSPSATSASATPTAGTSSAEGVLRYGWTVVMAVVGAVAGFAL